MKLRPNLFKAAIKDGQQQVGLWSMMCSNVAAEITAYSGYDWVVLDMEHSPNDYKSILSQLQAYGPSRTEPVVRPPWNDAVMVKKVLDLGVFTLLFPMVETADDARRAVAATRYPPSGVRGVALGNFGNKFGRVTDYFERIADEICVLVQLESEQAMSNIAEIAAVDGVDGLFIGPSDLSASMGHLSKPANPATQILIANGLAEIKSANKPAGILSGAEADGIQKLKDGFTFVAVGSDNAILARSIDGQLARVREAVGLEASPVRIDDDTY
ncbi:MAG: HpcH/HpaI aldolase family protein [Hyphomicrobiaceae bacterium]